MSSYSIMLVDDHPIIRDGLKQLLTKSDDGLLLDMLAESSEQALELLKSNRPDLVMCDLSMAGMDGISLIQLLSDRYPTLPTLVFSMHDDRLYAPRAIRAGAKGYVNKAESPFVLREAIITILNGGEYFRKDISAAEKRRILGEQILSDLLSGRELEILILIGEGFDSFEIKQKINVSIKTVSVYISHIKDALNLPDDRALYHFASEVVQQGGAAAIVKAVNNAYG